MRDEVRGFFQQQLSRPMADSLRWEPWAVQGLKAGRRSSNRGCDWLGDDAHKVGLATFGAGKEGCGYPTGGLCMLPLHARLARRPTDLARGLTLKGSSGMQGICAKGIARAAWPSPPVCEGAMNAPAWLRVRAQRVPLTCRAQVMTAVMAICRPCCPQSPGAATAIHCRLRTRRGFGCGDTGEWRAQLWRREPLGQNIDCCGTGQCMGGGAKCTRATRRMGRGQTSASKGARCAPSRLRACTQHMARARVGVMMHTWAQSALAGEGRLLSQKAEGAGAGRHTGAQGKARATGARFGQSQKAEGAGAGRHTGARGKARATSARLGNCRRAQGRQNMRRAREGG